MPRKSAKEKDQLSNESVKKLVKEAFLPAFVLVITKLLSMLALPALLGYQYSVEWVWTIFPLSFVFETTEQALVVNSYANLVMYGMIFVGFFWVLVKSYHFHDSHIKPRTSAKLSELKMLHLITTSFELYHTAFVWFCFMWLSVIVISIYYLLGLSFIWVFIGTFLVSVLMTYLLIDDLEKEFLVWRLFHENR